MQTNAQQEIPLSVIAKLTAYHEAEMVWMDAHVRAQWWPWICKLAERNGFLAHLLRVFIARYSGLEVVRNKNMGVNTLTKGFRKGVTIKHLEAVTTTIFKHKPHCKVVMSANRTPERPDCNDACVVDRQRFEIGIPIN